MNNAVTHSGFPSQTKKPQDYIPVVHVNVMFYILLLFPLVHFADILSPCSFPPLRIPFLLFQFKCPGTQAQQAFRTEPRNLTVQMGATAVLRCEVLRASGTVQWVKDGLLLGPQRSLPGFPRYSMIGNPKRGTQTCNKIQGLLDINGPIQAE